MPKKLAKLFIYAMLLASMQGAFLTIVIIKALRHEQQEHNNQPETNRKEQPRSNVCSPYDQIKKK